MNSTIWMNIQILPLLPVVLPSPKTFFITELFCSSDDKTIYMQQFITWTFTYVMIKRSTAIITTDFIQFTNHITNHIIFIR